MNQNDSRNLFEAVWRLSARGIDAKTIEALDALLPAVEATGRAEARATFLLSSVVLRQALASERNTARKHGEELLALVSRIRPESVFELHALRAMMDLERSAGDLSAAERMKARAVALGDRLPGEGHATSALLRAEGHHERGAEDEAAVDLRRAFAAWEVHLTRTDLSWNDRRQAIFRLAESALLLAELRLRRDHLVEVEAIVGAVTRRLASFASVDAWLARELVRAWLLLSAVQTHRGLNATARIFQRFAVHVAARGPWLGGPDDPALAAARSQTLQYPVDEAWLDEFWVVRVLPNAPPLVAQSGRGIFIGTPVDGVRVTLGAIVDVAPTNDEGVLTITSRWQKP